MTTQFKTPTADLQHQYDLLQKEFEYEKEMYREQTERAGIHRRIQQGLCWYPVVPGKSYYNSLNQLVVEIGQLEDKETEHNFEYGRPVCFFTTKGGGKPEYLNFSAVISYVQDDRMVVILPSPNALTEIQKAGEIGVQLYFDETSYKTMFNALFQTAEDMVDSHNAGVLFLGGDKVRVRTFGEPKDYDLSGKNDLPVDLEKLIVTLRDKYSYLYL